MFRKSNNDAVFERFDKIDKALAKMQSDVKKLKERVEAVLNAETDAKLLNDEELWRREQKKARENGF